MNDGKYRFPAEAKPDFANKTPMEAVTEQGRSGCQYCEMVLDNMGTAEKVPGQRRDLQEAIQWYHNSKSKQNGQQQIATWNIEKALEQFEERIKHLQCHPAKMILKAWVRYSINEACTAADDVSEPKAKVRAENLLNGILYGKLPEV